MNTSGSGLLLAMVALVVLLVLGAALFFAPVAAGAGVGAPGTGSLTVSASAVRNPSGVSAVIILTNSGTRDVRNFRITRLVVQGMNGGPPMPYLVGGVRSGGSVTVTIPFSGRAPAANAPVSLSIDYTFQEGWFGKGAGSSGVTSVVP
jgi:hypothetical protein